MRLSGRITANPPEGPALPLNKACHGRRVVARVFGVTNRRIENCLREPRSLSPFSWLRAQTTRAQATQAPRRLQPRKSTFRTQPPMHLLGCNQRPVVRRFSAMMVAVHRQVRSDLLRTTTAIGSNQTPPAVARLTFMGPAW